MLIPANTIAQEAAPDVAKPPGPRILPERVVKSFKTSASKLFTKCTNQLQTDKEAKNMEPDLEVFAQKSPRD